MVQTADKACKRRKRFRQIKTGSVFCLLCYRDMQNAVTYGLVSSLFCISRRLALQALRRPGSLLTLSTSWALSVVPTWSFVSPVRFYLASARPPASERESVTVSNACLISVWVCPSGFISMFRASETSWSACLSHASMAGLFSSIKA